MGVEVEEYVARWIEITVDEPSGMDPKQVLLFGTDLQYRLNGRAVTLRLEGCLKRLRNDSHILVSQPHQ